MTLTRNHCFILAIIHMLGLQIIYAQGPMVIETKVDTLSGCIMQQTKLNNGRYCQRVTRTPFCSISSHGCFANYAEAEKPRAQSPLNSSWTILDRRSPSEGYNYAVYDRENQRMVTFGGCVQPDFFDSTFQAYLVNSVFAMDLTLDEEEWHKLELTSGPASRWRHSLIYDSARDRMIVLGGQDWYEIFGDIWALDLSNIGQEHWHQLSPTGPAPGFITNHMAVYDENRNRMIVLAGYGMNQYFSLDSLWTLDFSNSEQGQWTIIHPFDTPPSLREGAGVVFDATRDRMIVFGGYAIDDSIMMSDVFILDFSQNPNGKWTELHPIGSLPTARWGCGATFIEALNYLFIFGGQGGIWPALFLINDTWILDLNSTNGQWLELSPNGWIPQARFFHCFIYDEENERSILFAGDTPPTEYHCDAFELKIEISGSINATWSRIPVLGETPRHLFGGVAEYDKFHSRMIISGGGDGLFWVFDDLYEMDLSMQGSEVWRSLTCPGLKTRDQVSVFDPVNQRMIMLGGPSLNLSPADRIYSLDLAEPGHEQWQVLDAPDGPIVGYLQLCKATAIYDSANHRMVVFGGYKTAPDWSGGPIHETWALDLTAGSEHWQLLNPGGEGPSARYAHTAIYDPIGQRMIIFGGCDYTTHDLYALDLTLNQEIWIKLEAQGEMPNFKWEASAIYAAGKMIVFGGWTYNDSNWIAANETFVLDLDSLIWTKLNPEGMLPEPRWEQVAIYDEENDQMIVFGGAISPGSWMINETNILCNLITGVVENASRPTPNAIRLLEIYPNPSRKETVIKYTLSSKHYVEDNDLPTAYSVVPAICIYDATGRSVKSFNHLTNQQFNQVNWSGTDDSGRQLPAGVYFVQLEAGDSKTCEKIILLK